MVIKKGTETIYDKILERSYPAGLMCEKQGKIYMLWFNFIIGLNVISLLFLGMAIYDDEFKTKGNKI